jgi:hypothetical protein
MLVVDHEPHVWFLLADSGRYYLDARVSRSAVEWSVLIELTEPECREYHATGKPFLHALAARIDDGANAFESRDVTKQLGAAVARAIAEQRGT